MQRGGSNATTSRERNRTHYMILEEKDSVKGVLITSWLVNRNGSWNHADKKPYTLKQECV
jgi:hypothetical protein